jgi:hypothetical protein
VADGAAGFWVVLISHSPVAMEFASAVASC